MNTIVIGASGGIGAALADRFEAQGDRVHRLSRSAGTIDLADAASIAAAAKFLPFAVVQRLVVATGLLHAEGLAPRAHCCYLVGDNLPGFVWQRGGHGAQLVRDRRRVGEESVDRDDCDQRGKDGQKGVKGNSSGQQWDLVGLGLLPAAFGYL